MPFWRNKDYNSGRWPTFVFGYLLTILEGLEFLGFLEWFFITLFNNFSFYIS